MPEADPNNNADGNHPSKAANPTEIVKAIISLLVALGGPQLLTTFAPPTENSGVLRAMLVAESAIAWLLAFLLATRWGKNVTTKSLNIRRIATAGIALVTLAVMGTMYLSKWEKYTVEFEGERVLTGKELTTPVGKRYFEKRPEASRREAVYAAGGKADDVWTIDSINAVRTQLMVFFQLTIPAAVFGVVFLFYCLTGTQPGGSDRLNPH